MFRDRKDLELSFECKEENRTFGADVSRDGQDDSMYFTPCSSPRVPTQPDAPRPLSQGGAFVL